MNTDELEGLKSFQKIIQDVISHKDYLASLPKDNLNNLQKLWLLAFETSELKIAKMGEEDSEESKNEVVTTTFVLKEAIEETK